VKPIIFFQLNFTIIFGIFNLKGAYAPPTTKSIIKAEWVVPNAKKSLKKASAVTIKKLCKQTLLIYWALIPLQTNLLVRILLDLSQKHLK
jgi:hypothetical protein